MSDMSKSSEPSRPHTLYPWTQFPLLVSAPMGGFATAPLATAVALAGGIGLIGSVTDMATLSAELDSACSNLQKVGFLDHRQSEVLPIGVGFLPFILPLEMAVPIVEKYRPAVIWLSFARHLGDYKVWSDGLRAVSPQSAVWVQLGSVTAALEVAKTAKPDALVIQGSDAGGHGFERSAGIVSLVPETRDALDQAGLAHIPLIAAGGIVDGRGVASAIALGAGGAVMGTRFLAARECVVPHKMYREAVLNAKDGGQATVRAKVFDELRGPNIWPEMFDGRALRNDSWRDAIEGQVAVEEIRARFSAAAKGEDGGYGADGTGRTMIWAGTGVGMVNKVQCAAEIVEEVRDGTVKALERARASLKML